MQSSIDPSLYSGERNKKICLTCRLSAEEEHLGISFVGSLLGQSVMLVKQGQDPIRFVRSFVRAHYAQRSLQALATLCQMLVEISAFHEGSQHLHVRTFGEL